MDREVFRVSLREIHTRFTADKLTRKDKDGDTRKCSRDSNAFRIDKAIRFRVKCFCFSQEEEKNECA